MQTFDYVIVGAGSAGCALAYRLSCNSNNKVLLLEAGGRDSNPLIHMPVGFTRLTYDHNTSWVYYTEPEVHMNGRRIHFPRGKVLGGSSSINGMIYIRGQQEDYNDWVDSGAEGWSYQELLPYFKRSENHLAGGQITDTHGLNGPLAVTNIETAFELSDAYLQAGIDTGLPLNADFNDGDQEGIGYYQVTIKDGKRQSTAVSYLREAEKRPNLLVQTKALTSKIVFHNKRAVGIEFTQNGESHQVSVRREVILCAGSINSPQILELSGVGQKEVLEKHGIEQVHELPGVGENLQDHLTVHVVYDVNQPITLADEAKPLPMIKNLFQYYAQKKGVLAFPAANVGAFIKGEGDERPAYQIHFAPAAGDLDDKGNTIPAENPGVTSTCCFLRPESRGSVHIKSSDPGHWPAIKANYLDTEEDRRRMVEAIRLQRQIFAGNAFKPYIGKEVAPGADVQSDEDILEYVKETAISVYHPVGTCKMGVDEMAVVDPELKVHGLQGLRIADGSIFPTVLSGNTNATCIAIGERCADMILHEHRHESAENTYTEFAAAASGCPYHGGGAAATPQEPESTAQAGGCPVDHGQGKAEEPAAAGGCPVDHGLGATAKPEAASGCPVDHGQDKAAEPTSAGGCPVDHGQDKAAEAEPAAAGGCPVDHDAMTATEATANTTVKQEKSSEEKVADADKGGCPVQHS